MQSAPGAQSFDPIDPRAQPGDRRRPSGRGSACQCHVRERWGVGDRAGRSGGRVRRGFASKHAPKESRGFGEPTRAGEARGLDDFAQVPHAVHVQGFHLLANKPSVRRRNALWLPVGKLSGSTPLRARHRVRSARAAFTAGLACSAPRTMTEPMVARASSGATSMAILARPSTWMWSVDPASRAASRSSRL
jgi:hypothetical protein